MSFVIARGKSQSSTNSVETDVTTTESRAKFVKLRRMSESYQYNDLARSNDMNSARMSNENTSSVIASGSSQSSTNAPVETNTERSATARARSNDQSVQSQVNHDKNCIKWKFHLTLNWSTISDSEAVRKRITRCKNRKIENIQDIQEKRGRKRKRNEFF